MKYDEIVQGEVYAFSTANATTDYYRPDEAIVLEKGGWRKGRGWDNAAAIVDRAAKESLVLVRHTYRAEEDETAPTEQAKQYTLEQARRYLALPRYDLAPDEVQPPEGWRIEVAQSRNLSMTWTRWLEVKAEREERTRKLMEARQAAHDANKEAETEMENTLARLGIPAWADGTARRVSLSFDAMIDLLNRIDKED